MDLLPLVLIIATLLCALTAGFVFAFATVVMPGIGKLSDREFIRGFQVMDGVIQKGQPIFGLVWIGSLISIVVAALMAALQLDGMERTLVLGSALVYIFGVQQPTLRINVPLNNALQKLDVHSMSEDALRLARRDFEDRWVCWNTIRTALAALVSAALMVALLCL